MLAAPVRVRVPVPVDSELGIALAIAGGLVLAVLLVLFVIHRVRRDGAAGRQGLAAWLLAVLAGVALVLFVGQLGDRLDLYYGTLAATTVLGAGSAWLAGRAGYVRLARSFASMWWVGVAAKVTLRRPIQVALVDGEIQVAPVGFDSPLLLAPLGALVLLAGLIAWTWRLRDAPD